MGDLNLVKDYAKYVGKGSRNMNLGGSRWLELFRHENLANFSNRGNGVKLCWIRSRQNMRTVKILSAKCTT
jgi:hypothetical protein